jgi:hypothetical protein
MKIVFQDSIIDIIAKRLHEGRAANKKAQYILITEEEYAELRSDHRFFQHCDDGMRAYFSASSPSEAMRNETVRTIELVDPAANRQQRSHYRFMSTMKFQGVDVYVVPARFM